MNSSRWLAAILVVVLAVFGVVVWQQRQVIDRLSGTPNGVPAGATSSGSTAGEAVVSLTPPLSTVAINVPVAGGSSKGAAGAEVVFIEYSDFQCPYCGQYQRTVYPRLISEYVDTGRVRYVFKNLPLESLHPDAMNAAVVAACAARQGKFWEVHDVFFANQRALAQPQLLASAGSAGADSAALTACVDTKVPADEIAASREEAVRAGFTGTPGFLVGRVDGVGMVHATRRLYGASPYSLFKSAIDDVLGGK